MFLIQQTVQARRGTRRESYIVCTETIRLFPFESSTR